MTEKKALEFAKQKGLYLYTSALYVGDWQGYAVYCLCAESPDGTPLPTGLPQWVLSSKSETRLAVGDECFELLDAFPDDEDE